MSEVHEMSEKDNLRLLSELDEDLQDKFANKNIFNFPLFF
jgi:hypothetical protein